jgi:hypothetical protein
MTAPVHSSPLAPEALHQGFLSILPRIEVHAQVCFRRIRCPGKRDDAVAETIAVAWKWFVAAAHRGKDLGHFPAALATLASRHVKSGRRLCGQERARDCFSSVAQTRYGFVVGKLPDFETLSDNPLTDALQDNTRSPVPDQVCFRLDFPCWLNTLSERDRRVVEDLMLGERTMDVARKHGISPGRVSQLRREFMVRWRHFCGEQAAEGPAAWA